MPQAQVFGGHSNGGEDDEFGGGQTHLQASVDDTDDLLDEIDSNVAVMPAATPLTIDPEGWN